MSDTPASTVPVPPAPAAPVSEFTRIRRHAGTVLVGQLAVMGFGITDTVVAGRHSDQALAALSVGAAYYISVYVSLLGVLQALLPVWAELCGAGRPLALGRSLRQSLYLWAGVAALGMLALLNPGLVLHLTEVPAALQQDVLQYLAVLALALPPALMFRIYSTLNQSLGKPKLVTWLQLGALALKVPLTWWFAFGGLGLPAGGVVGCAWATLLVNGAMLAVALGLLRRAPLYRPYQLWRRPERPDWQEIARFARLGVPGGLSILVEVTSFTLMALFIARLGTAAAAAHQIASNVAGVCYMVPLSLGIATSARVSYWLGAGQPDRARAAMGAGFRLAALATSALVAAIFIAREWLAGFYTAQPAVAAAAALLLAWVALYHLADAVQALCVFVLRCYRVTLAPLLAYSLLLWGLGLGGGYWLAYRGLGAWPAQQSAVAFWAMAVLALALVALALSALLWRAAHQPPPSLAEH